MVRSKSCPSCGAVLPEKARFCPNCGIQLAGEDESALPKSFDFLVTTSPYIPGYEIRKILGIVTGLTVRTRGFGGKFVASMQSLFGGEVTAFTYEMQKARIEAISRMIEEAKKVGANAVISVDIETSSVLQSLVLISATGTAVIAEPQ